jgi:hypothetical protein
MPLHTATVSERFKRQVQNESGTSDDQPPRPPPPAHMRFKYNKVQYLKFDVLMVMSVTWQIGTDVSEELEYKLHGTIFQKTVT